MAALTPEELALLPAAVRREMEEVEQLALRSQETGSADDMDDAGGAPQIQQTVEPALGDEVEDPVAGATNWQQLYDELLQENRTLSGKYKAEVPRLQREIASLRQQLAEAEQRAVEPQDPTEKYGLDADEADYGESLWRGTEKVAQKHASEVEQRLNERLEEVQRELETARHQSFLDDLRKRIPNFDAFNEDARFLGWLDQPDSLRGVMRQQLLDEAVTARDAARVAAVFEAFLTNSGVRSQSAPTSLAAQVVPPASGSLTANTSGKPIYSLAQWEAAMDQAARLQTSKPQRAQQLIQELDLALREGRVRYPQQRAAPG